MKHIDPSQNEPITDQALAHWAQAFSHVADHYRVACSPAPWWRTLRGSAANR
jgi:ATP-binding cassette subfamily C protein LapB